MRVEGDTQTQRGTCWGDF